MTNKTHHKTFSKKIAIIAVVASCGLSDASAGGSLDAHEMDEIGRSIGTSLKPVCDSVRSFCGWLWGYTHEDVDEGTPPVDTRRSSRPEREGRGGPFGHIGKID